MDLVARLFPDAIPPDSCEPGAYLLTITLAAPLSGRFARTPFTLAPGNYAYCGSANGPGGIAARVGRHLRAEKKAHWHVDQLTMAAAGISALGFPGGSECLLVERLVAAGATFPLPGFGSSDCRCCTSHLLDLRHSRAGGDPGRSSACLTGSPPPRG
jgi:Uri superfamily endonuclease